ncbi:transcription elongation factor, mitochondrial [Aulostomus maculatus]
MKMWVARRFLSLVTHSGRVTGHAGLFKRTRIVSLPELEIQYLQCTCCWRSRVPVACFETLNASTSSTSSDHCKHDDSVSLDACYTSEQRDTILQILNNGTPADLAGIKLLRGRKSLSIVDYRTKNGPFKTLESLVKVPRFKHKSAVIVFNAILNPVKKKKVKSQLGKFIRPEVDVSWLEDANSIVSVVSSTTRISWAHVDRGMMVLDWQQIVCPNFLKGSYMASAYLNDVSAAVSCLPSADFYIIEKPSISVPNSALLPIVTHMRTVEAMLFALLEPKNTPPDINIPPRVLNMIRNAVGRHFGLMVGDSRTSGVQVVQQLMTESVTQKNPRVHFPAELLFKYRKAFGMGKGKGEELCDALLQAVAFYELLGESSS